MADKVVLNLGLRVALGELVERIVEVDTAGSEAAPHFVDQLEHQVAPVLQQAGLVEGWQVDVSWVQIHEIRKQGIDLSDVDRHVDNCFSCSAVYLENVHSCLVEANGRVYESSLLNVSRAGIAADVHALELLAWSQQNDLVLQLCVGSPFNADTCSNFYFERKR